MTRRGTNLPFFFTFKTVGNGVYHIKLTEVHVWVSYLTIIHTFINSQAIVSSHVVSYLFCIIPSTVSYNHSFWHFLLALHVSLHFLPLNPIFHFQNVTQHICYVIKSGSITTWHGLVMHRVSRSLCATLYIHNKDGSAYNIFDFFSLFHLVGYRVCFFDK